MVTNRHVVDPDFSSPAPARASVRRARATFRVKLLGQLAQPGEVVWIAPDGIDLALVRVAVHTAGRAAPWRREPRLGVGDEVFSIGNPHHLDWTHTGGRISQFRPRRSADEKSASSRPTPPSIPATAAAGSTTSRAC